ncbi:MAG: UDP-glucose 4-epimerase GalE [Gracilibacteraceae bacterium]|jgi:UDP-glucose 4-epimerase|nr:UDP-glucose 4-epimerase GalE [Gracilibacteraceae bacterium]
MSECFLVTGGTGYIGSHVCALLLAAGRDVVILDDLSNSSADVPERLESISGRKPLFYCGDVRDAARLAEIVSAHKPEYVLHFAGLKAVGESGRNPLAYYDVNVGGTITLLRVLQRYGIRRFVFSSSATVYAPDAVMPLTEESPLGPYNPYGRTKYTVERVLLDLAAGDPSWRVALLRYFNPVGAHASGLLGEKPQGEPNNLMPRLCAAAAGATPPLTVFGTDYPTRDGSGVRDYLHVTDLALGHLRAVERLEQAAGVHTYNLGTGTGLSVLELIAAFQAAVGIAAPWTACPRRAGDLAEYYSSPAKAERELGWKAEKTAEDMCRDAWAFYLKAGCARNPDGESK